MPERNLRFQQKLWHIVNCCKTGAVSWSNSGDSIIFKFSQFKKEYLDRNVNFCKSNKIASFVRQLNLYGFRKLIKVNATKRRVDDFHEFQNMHFRRGRRDLLEHVVRSSATPAPLSRQSRKRGRKGKQETLVKKEAGNNRKNLENQKFNKIKANKENMFHPAEKYSVSSLWNSQKNMCERKKNNTSVFSMTNQIPVAARIPLRDCGNVCKNESNCQPEGIQKPLDCKIFKQDLQNKKVKLEPVEIKKELPESKPTDQSFPNLDDDFSLDSEETNEADDDPYKNIDGKVDDRENYKNDIVVLNAKSFSTGALNNLIKFNRNNWEKSVEQLELEEAYMRGNNRPRLLFYCVCNPNMPPSCVI